MEKKKTENKLSDGGGVLQGVKIGFHPSEQQRQKKKKTVLGI